MMLEYMNFFYVSCGRDAAIGLSMIGVLVSHFFALISILLMSFSRKITAVLSEKIAMLFAIILMFVSVVNLMLSACLYSIGLI